MILVSNFTKIFKKIFWITKGYQKRYLILILLLLALTTSFTEIVALGTFLPLLDLLLDTNKYINNEIFYSIINFFNLEIEEITIYILFFFAIILIISYLFKILLIWLAAYLTHDISYYLNNKVFDKTIKQDYKYFKSFNTSIFLGNLEKAELARGAIFSLFQLIVSSILFFSVFFFVLFQKFRPAVD